MGTPYGWFRNISTRIHIDQIIEAFAVNCPNLERLGKKIEKRRNFVFI